MVQMVQVMYICGVEGVRGASDDDTVLKMAQVKRCSSSAGGVTGAAGADGVNAAGSTCDGFQSSRCMGGGAKGVASTRAWCSWCIRRKCCRPGRCKYKNSIRACSF
jgi:hypothetical protein